MVHGGLVKLFSEAGDLAVYGIKGLVFHRLLAA
jgi:hypothetical protein